MIKSLLAIFLVYCVSCVIVQAEPQFFSTGQTDVGGGLAAAGLDNTVYCVDITSPSRPRVVGRITLPSRVLALELHFPRLFAGLENGTIQAIDVRDAARPVMSETLELKGPVTSLQFASDRLHAAAREFAIIRWSEGPRVIGRKELLQTGRLAVFGSWAYFLTSGAQGPAVHLLQWPDPSAPQFIDKPLPIKWGRLAQSGAIAVAADDQGLAVFDVAQPTEPILLAQRPVSFSIRDLQMTTRTLYLLGPTSFEIDGLSSKHLPEFKGGLDISEPIALRVRGEQAFVLDALGVLHVIDIRNAAEPLETATLSLIKQQRRAEGQPLGLFRADQTRRFSARGLKSTTGSLARPRMQVPLGAVQ